MQRKEGEDMKKAMMLFLLQIGCSVFLLLGLTGMATASSMNIDGLAFVYKQGDSQSRVYALEDQVYRYDLSEGNPLAAFNGVYEFMYLGYEAGNTDTLTSGLGTTFTNKTSSVFSTANFDINSAAFNDTVIGPSGVYLTGTNNLDIYKVAGSFLYQMTGNGWFDAGKEYFIIGFNDGYRGDKDYDDLVIAVEVPAMNTPIPSAVLLLGSGIMGLIGVGVRQRRRT
jgi:hypothetical protein